ncbi:unnamed protein product [Prorocentrum cordatum]|uniref:Uncharacterized protein n=1 Tax=Prorocentrum cordatum TaxID=2364126 RepID=A0ABN9X959_9DINO|nr:unnamed protein product [Polarella glacialis]
MPPPPGSLSGPAATELAPQPSAPPLPNYSGCFVWLPSGCRAAHPFAAQPQWRQDRWGEANLRSAGSKAACDARKSAFDGWCRVTDAVMAHVPSSAQRVPSQGVVPQGAGVDGTSLQTDVGVSRAAGPARTKSHADHPRRTLPEDAPPLPDGAGCYVWLPSGCKAQHARAARVWMRTAPWTSPAGARRTAGRRATPAGGASSSCARCRTTRWWSTCPPRASGQGGLTSSASASGPPASLLRGRVGPQSHVSPIPPCRAVTQHGSARLGGSRDQANVSFAGIFTALPL